MKMKDRMVWGESLEMIAAYVADTLHIGQEHGD